MPLLKPLIPIQIFVYKKVQSAAHLMYGACVERSRSVRGVT